ARTSTSQDSGATVAPEFLVVRAPRYAARRRGANLFFQKERAACHPERSARNARVAKDLLCLWYRTAGPSLRKRRENQADQRSGRGQRRLLPRGEYEQQRGPQAGQGCADQQVATFGGKLNRHQRHDRPMGDTGPDGV